MNDSSFEKIDINSIVMSPYQPRKNFNLYEIEKLAISIKTVGLLHPPIVRKFDDNNYELISGERRIRACKILNIDYLQVLVLKNVDEEISYKASLCENMIRSDLNAMEVALAIKNLQDRYFLKHEEIADILGKRRSTISNYLRLISLPNKVKEYIEKGTLSLAHAKIILKLKYNVQLMEEIAIFIINNSLSVEKTRNLVASKNPLYLNQYVQIEGSIKKISLMLSLEAKISRVKIKKDNFCGTISINFESKNDLQKILETLSFGSSND